MVKAIEAEPGRHYITKKGKEVIVLGETPDGKMLVNVLADENGTVAKKEVPVDADYELTPCELEPEPKPEPKAKAAPKESKPVKKQAKPTKPEPKKESKPAPKAVSKAKAKPEPKVKKEAKAAPKSRPEATGKGGKNRYGTITIRSVVLGVLDQKKWREGRLVGDRRVVVYDAIKKAFPKINVDSAAINASISVTYSQWKMANGIKLKPKNTGSKKPKGKGKAKKG